MVRPALRSLATVLAVLLLASACGGGGGKKKTAAKGTTTSVEDTSTTGADTSTTGSGGATATTKAAAGKSTTPAAGNKVNGQASGNYQPPAGAKAATPPTPGTYRYDTSGSTTFGAQTSSPPPVTPLAVDPPSGTRQHTTRDMRTPDGNGLFLGTSPIGNHLSGTLDEVSIYTTALSATQVLNHFNASGFSELPCLPSIAVRGHKQAFVDCAPPCRMACLGCSSTSPAASRASNSER